MDDDDRQGIRLAAALVDKVEPQTIYARGVVAPLVKLLFLRAPVIAGLPILHKLPQIFRVGAIVPTRVTNMVRPARLFQALLQVQ